MDDEVADFVHYLETTPGALEEFLASHAAASKWPWQRLYWWCHLHLFSLRTAIFGERP